MKTPRVTDFDPDAKVPTLKSSLDNMPSIQNPRPIKITRRLNLPPLFKHLTYNNPNRHVKLTSWTTLLTLLYEMYVPRTSRTPRTTRTP
jgi:hypothetical protein